MGLIRERSERKKFPAPIARRPEKSKVNCLVVTVNITFKWYVVATNIAE